MWFIVVVVVMVVTVVVIVVVVVKVVEVVVVVYLSIHITGFHSLRGGSKHGTPGFKETLLPPPPLHLILS